MLHFYPVSQAGGPDSGVYQWADKFFSVHIQQMVDMGVISQHSGDEMLADWIAHRENPDSIFVSPTIINAAGKLAE
jgi:hypothetical protein